jgi:hypothetical protein
MASPSAAGSVNLIAQEIETATGATPLSSTLKALVINTADEAGANSGPDYQNGWGLLNTRRALDVVHAGAGADLGMRTGSLAGGQVDEYYFANTSGADIRVTLVWTDPPATVLAPAVDPATARLVNDLDLVLEDPLGGSVWEPWNLNRVVPAAAATQGPNHVDNVEQIDVAGAPLGIYKVSVSHTGALTGGAQAYALVFRGMHEAPTPVGKAARAPSFWIGDPRPNPVSSTAAIDFGADGGEEVSIHVYDVAGRRVATLLRAGRVTSAGTVTLDASGLASGIYFVRMESASRTATRKIAIVK